MLQIVWVRTGLTMGDPIRTKDRKFATVFQGGGGSAPPCDEQHATHSVATASTGVTLDAVENGESSGQQSTEFVGGHRPTKEVSLVQVTPLFA